MVDASTLINAHGVRPYINMPRLKNFPGFADFKKKIIDDGFDFANLHTGWSIGKLKPLSQIRSLMEDPEYQSYRGIIFAKGQNEVLPLFGGFVLISDYGFCMKERSPLFIDVGGIYYNRMLPRWSVEYKSPFVFDHDWFDYIVPFDIDNFYFSAFCKNKPDVFITDATGIFTKSNNNNYYIRDIDTDKDWAFYGSMFDLNSDLNFLKIPGTRPVWGKLILENIPKIPFDKGYKIFDDGTIFSTEMLLDEEMDLIEYTDRTTGKEYYCHGLLVNPEWFHIEE